MNLADQIVKLYYDWGWTENKTNLFEKSIIRFDSRGNPIVIIEKHTWTNCGLPTIYGSPPWMQPAAILENPLLL